MLCIYYGVWISYSFTPKKRLHIKISKFRSFPGCTSWLLREKFVKRKLAWNLSHSRSRMLEVGIPAIKLSPRASLQHRHLASWEGGRKEPTSIPVYWSNKQWLQNPFLASWPNKQTDQTNRQTIIATSTSYILGKYKPREGGRGQTNNHLQHLHLAAWLNKQTSKQLFPTSTSCI